MQKTSKMESNLHHRYVFRLFYHVKNQNNETDIVSIIIITIWFLNKYRYYANYRLNPSVTSSNKRYSKMKQIKQVDESDVDMN